MAVKDFQTQSSLVVVANEYPDADFREKLEDAHSAEYFREIYLRWRELFALVPEAKEIAWHDKIDFPDADLFYNTMRLVVEADSTPADLYGDIVAMTDGLTLRWKEFLALVPAAGKIDWMTVADRFCHPDADRPDAI